jgi:deoxyribose-phosphate aldolase
MAKTIKVRGIELTPDNLAGMIDHSVLHPDSTKEMIDEGLQKCREYPFNAYCVNPNYLEYIVPRLEGTGVPPTVVIDFPFGAGTKAIKVAAAKDMIKKGAKALDMVIDIGALKNGNYDLVVDEIKEIVRIAEDGGAETKIIIEAGLLTDDEIVTACKAVAEAQATYVKSSTGRAPGPSAEVIKLMRDSSPPEIGVKVAGTGRFWTPEVALGAILAGADLIGTRAGAQIVAALPFMIDMYWGDHVEQSE